MRFGIRDLLLTTTVLAVYASVGGVLVRRSIGMIGQVDWLSHLFATAIIVFLISRELRGLLAQRTAERGSQLKVRFGHGVWWHLATFGYFLLHVVPHLRSQSPDVPLFLLPAVLAIHLGIELGTSLVFNERGFFSQGRFFDWSDYDVTLKTDPPRLVCWRNPNEERHAPNVINLPVDSVDSVREFLAVKQHLEEEPPMDADGRR